LTNLSTVKQLLDSLNDSERQEILGYLRKALPLHPVEQKLMASAETILEAIGRSPDLTVRGIEGIIAEAAFATEVVPTLAGWAEQSVPAGLPYDFLLDDGQGPVKLQVKMQRRKDRKPLRASEVRKSKKWSSEYFVVETQRTRGGKTKTGKATRPYRFGEFDLLAVSMGASQGRWSAFMYTVQRWLLPSDNDASCLNIYQPVPPAPNEFWTDEFTTCVGRLRSGLDHRIEAK
jgi:hypothetical protein